ncbi:MAG: DUF6056 family protein [Butyrivibrio sp.]|nr:DUF6056 family protein [Acetatifactor muris]MCM1559712.1 DUF6056 family protein [Butyrivibrio sp.]
MSVTTKQKKAIWIMAGIMTAVSALVMYMTHREVPFMMDDFWYSTVLFEDRPITSFGDIIKSQIWHYYNWGGRSMAHGILQLTLLSGEQAADILNVGMTLLLGRAACMAAGQKGLPFFWAAVGMTLGLNANWKMSMFWQAGAANYLYMTVFILLYAFCYLRELPEEGEAFSAKPLPGITLWIMPLGILAGWSNENMGPAVWILSLLVIVDTVRKKKKIAAWMPLGSLSCLAGSGMLICAPGNFVRSGESVENQYGLLWRCYLRMYAESKALLEYLFPVLLVLGLVLVLGRCALKISLGRRNGALLFTALLSWGAMLLSPHYPDRAAFGTMLLLICVILSMAGKIVRERQDLCWPLFGAAAVIWLRGMYFCGEFLGVCWGWIK